MNFTKMQGCGNDYIYVNGAEETVEDKPEAARLLSDRHFGIGSDGLIFINPSRVADFEMEMYNADGSRSEMCGNGIRCVAKYVYDHGLTDKEELLIETGAGIKTVYLNIEDGYVESVSVNMGSPILKCSEIPVAIRGDEAVNVPINVGGKNWYMTCVSMGNPHAVVFVEDVDSLDLTRIGPGFEYHNAFPKRTNTEFVRVFDREHIRMRVWERGTGETLACGTGASASVVASILCGHTEDSVEVELLGGTLNISWNREENTVWMTGPAETVFEGKIIT
ncbi:MAG: diaminopimelate epimerase [Lachnospiraceae bacterium]|nr:diaminopimelate epimerase [Lachnospiraceae bacterium]